LLSITPANYRQSRLSQHSSIRGHCLGGIS
jgi:hypothetical protein